MPYLPPFSPSTETPSLAFACPPSRHSISPLSYIVRRALDIFPAHPAHNAVFSISRLPLALRNENPISSPTHRFASSLCAYVREESWMSSAVGGGRRPHSPVDPKTAPANPHRQEPSSCKPNVMLTRLRKNFPQAHLAGNSSTNYIPRGSTYLRSRGPSSTKRDPRAMHGFEASYLQRRAAPNCYSSAGRWLCAWMSAGSRSFSCWPSLARSWCVMASRGKWMAISSCARFTTEFGGSSDEGSRWEISGFGRLGYWWIWTRCRRNGVDVLGFRKVVNIGTWS